MENFLSTKVTFQGHSRSSEMAQFEIKHTTSI